MDFQVEQGQHSVQAETQMLTFWRPKSQAKFWRAKGNFCCTSLQPSAYWAAPLHPPLPWQSICTGVQLCQTNSQPCVCFQVTFTETQKWLQWRRRSGFNFQWTALETGKSQVTSLLTERDHLSTWFQVAFFPAVTGSVAIREWCILMFSAEYFVWKSSAVWIQTTHPALLNGSIYVFSYRLSRKMHNIVQLLINVLSKLYFFQ